MNYLEAALKTTGYSLESWQQKCAKENEERERIAKEQLEKFDKENPKPKYQKKSYDSNFKSKNKSNKFFKGNHNKKPRKTNTEYDKAINYARNIFVKECCITDKKELDKMVYDSQYILDWSKKVWHNFDEESDAIDMSGHSDSCKFKFTRSRFFTSSDFKNDVIKYYSSICPEFWIQFIKPKSKNAGLMICSKRR